MVYIFFNRIYFVYFLGPSYLHFYNQPFVLGIPAPCLFFFFLATLDLRRCAWAFSSCSEGGLLFVAVCRLLIVVASLVAEHGL